MRSKRRVEIASWKLVSCDPNDPRNDTVPAHRASFRRFLSGLRIAALRERIRESGSLWNSRRGERICLRIKGRGEEGWKCNRVRWKLSAEKVRAKKVCVAWIIIGGYTPGVRDRVGLTVAGCKLHGACEWFSPRGNDRSARRRFSQMSSERWSTRGERVARVPLRSRAIPGPGARGRVWRKCGSRYSSSALSSVQVRKRFSSTLWSFLEWPSFVLCHVGKTLNRPRSPISRSVSFAIHLLICLSAIWENRVIGAMALRWCNCDKSYVSS